MSINFGPRTSMPHKKKIKAYWAKTFVAIGKFDSVTELYEADYCFACGDEHRTERAHMKAHIDGGSEDVWNLHLLCSACHKDSEFLTGVDYWKWLLRRNGFQAEISRWMQQVPQFREDILPLLYKVVIEKKAVSFHERSLNEQP